MPPRQEMLRSQQIAMPFLGIVFAPSTQPSGSELAAPSFAGHIDCAASSPTGHNVMEVVEIFPSLCHAVEQPSGACTAHCIPSMMGDST